jgi:hypothetical protein
MAASFWVSVAEPAVSPSDANVTAGAAEPNADCSCPVAGAFRAPSPLCLPLIVCTHGQSIVSHPNTKMHATTRRERIRWRQRKASYVRGWGVATCSQCHQQHPRRWQRRSKPLFCLSTTTGHSDVITACFAKRHSKTYVASQRLGSLELQPHKDARCGQRGKEVDPDFF